MMLRRYSENSRPTGSTRNSRSFVWKSTTELPGRCSTSLHQTVFVTGLVSDNRARESRMGFSITWCAVREEGAQKFLDQLDLSPTGETEEIPESLISAAKLDTGWRVI